MEAIRGKYPEEHLDSLSQTGSTSPSEQDTKIPNIQEKQGSPGWTNELPPPLIGELFLHADETAKQPGTIFGPENLPSESLEDIFDGQSVVLIPNIALPKSKLGVLPAADAMLQDRSNDLYNDEHMRVIVHPMKSNAAGRQALNHRGESYSWLARGDEDINLGDGWESDKLSHEEREDLGNAQQEGTSDPARQDPRVLHTAVDNNIVEDQVDSETRLREFEVKASGLTGDKFATAIALEDRDQNRAWESYPSDLVAKIEPEANSAVGRMVRGDGRPPASPANEGAIGTTDGRKEVDGKTVAVGAGAVALAVLTGIWLINKFKGRKAHKVEKTHGRRHARHWKVDSSD